MLRNDLITGLSEQNNDPVVVKIAGSLVDVASVIHDDGCVVLVLEPEELNDALATGAASERRGYDQHSKLSGPL